MKSQKGNALVVVLIYFTVITFGVVGWVSNIVKIADADFGHVTGMLVLRCFGVLMAPLGAILGYC